ARLCQFGFGGKCASASGPAVTGSGVSVPAPLAPHHPGPLLPSPSHRPGEEGDRWRRAGCARRQRCLGLSQGGGWAFVERGEPARACPRRMLPCSNGSYTQHTRPVKAAASWVVVAGLAPQVAGHDGAQVATPLRAPDTLIPSRMRSDSMLSLSLLTFFFMADLLTVVGIGPSPDRGPSARTILLPTRSAPERR